MSEPWLRGGIVEVVARSKFTYSRDRLKCKLFGLALQGLGFWSDLMSATSLDGLLLSWRAVRSVLNHVRMRDIKTSHLRTYMVGLISRQHYTLHRT